MQDNQFRNSYIHIAHALARGYTDLFYVNTDTGEYIEYHTDVDLGVLNEARRGTAFFESCELEARQFVHPEDQAAFIHAMNRDFLSEALSGNKVYTLTYRRILDGRTFYVEMKVSRMEDDRRFIVIAVADIDELMRKRFAEKRIQEERIIYARLHALTGNYICVYVVDPETDNYREFSATDDYVQIFSQAKEGTDFFTTVREAALKFNYPDDMPLFLSLFTKDNILAEIESSGIFTMVYRFIMDGRPLHVQMSAAMVDEIEGRRLIVGLSDIDAQYRQRIRTEEIERQNEIYDQINASLAAQYDELYYIDVETGTYSEISSTDEFWRLNVPATGNDFFAESRRSIRKYVHPDDQEKALRVHYKDMMLENLKSGNSFSLDYRLVVNNRVRHIRNTEIMAKDGKHIIVCIKNIDAEVEARRALKEDQRKSATYTQIAEGLASHYDLIYYIDCANSNYAEFSTKKKSSELKVQDEGEDFFAAAVVNAERLLFSEDKERILMFLDRDNLISQLEKRRQLTADYRMNIKGGKVQYTRMSVTYSSDKSHFIICIENRDRDVRREQEHLQALSMANDMARRDELTHTRNKTAYREMEKELQKQIEEGSEPFGILVCDINELKLVNDTEGHKAGDEYIKASCSIICRLFSHSPVFRIGGDEFAVILRGQDYENREALISLLRSQMEDNVLSGEGPVVASGMAELLRDTDRSVVDVFNRADSRMYENKTYLKEARFLQETNSVRDRNGVRIISDERRIKIDSLFKSFELVAEGSYVYLCDMKYDFSRWSKSAVDAFGLPSEYMYGAGDIWENHIHPEDRATYHKGIDEIFSGTASDHDMQYRAMRTNGEYDTCTCRGVVLRDGSGEADYFVGTIRNHSIQGHVDLLTGFRNQYGFFEDLDGAIIRNKEISVVLFGISRFSEINEMYGYHFGNRVLQVYARKAFESSGNTGHMYRIDGTKFALISNTLPVEELRVRYDRFRESMHEGLQVDDRNILLDLHCGALRLNNFDVDSQTVYACLNFADEESKIRKRGNLVEFGSELNDDSHQRLEQLHAIRASIMRGYEGFYLLYQPVVDAQTEQLAGAEALLRWKNDRYGTVPPDQFIPILESDPLFPEMGEWILREAILEAKKILADDPAFIINVNLSYTQLERPDFADMVFRILTELGYPPENLCLEITERCRLLDLGLLKNVITRLKSRGVIIAMDDFGTGFSSLSIVKELPIDIIKIDRSFVRTIETDNTGRLLVGNIVDLASIYGAKVCVEGIETGEMRDILQKYRVDSFQGYYYAKPLLPENLAEWSR